MMFYSKKKEEEQKTYSREVNIDCNINKNQFYSYENVLLNCKIKNLGNIFLENLNLCFDKGCKTFNLGISQENYDFNFSTRDYFDRSEKWPMTLNRLDLQYTGSLRYEVKSAFYHELGNILNVNRSPKRVDVE